MISRTSFFAAVLGASSILLACSSDTGKPSDGTTSGAPAPSATNTTSPEAGTPEAGTNKASLLGACMKDDDCASGTCYIDDQGNRYCSLKCTGETAATVCVAPLAGTCNKKGFCKKP
jgi:hypothetical protein